MWRYSSLIFNIIDNSNLSVSWSLISLNHLTSLSLPFAKLSCINLDLSKLSLLNLSHNEFTQIPDCIIHLVSLQRLDMSYNKLESGTAVMRILPKLSSNLTNLDLRYNPINTLFYPQAGNQDDGKFCKALSDSGFVKRNCYRAGCVMACAGLAELDGIKVDRVKSARTFDKLRRGVTGSLRASNGSARASSERLRSSGGLRESRGAMNARELDVMSERELGSGVTGDDSLFRDWKPVSYPISGEHGGENLVLRVSTRMQ